ncbi:MAG: hypothetical protein R3336_07725, partial [Phycisphaeraceae bacterium]|nr:hypothetical protein [Phycisphaeraceae bacterium]
GDTLARLAEALAAGGQFSINPFYGGSAGGFLTGRRPTADGTWLTGAFDHAAPITEAGETTDTARTIKRIATFATQFASLLAHADLDASHHAALAPEEDPKGLSVIHHRGPQGNPVFFIRGKKHDAKQTSLLLPNGVTLPIPLGNDRAAWVALNAPLTTDAELSWTNLRPWAFLEDRLLVLFGPAGADGIVAINEAPLEIDVPRGRTPAVVEHEGVTIAVLNTEQVDAAVIGPEGLLIGADGLDADDQPRPLKGYRRATLVTPDGQTLTRTTGDTPRAGRAPSLSGWQQARVLDKIDGEDAAYDTLDGPTPLGAIDATSHYAWYRLQIKNVDTKTVMAPGAGDRLHVFQDGKLKTILGEGPHGQRGPLKLPLEGTTTILADTPGRFVSGWRQNEPKGLYDHIYGVEETDMGKPERTTGSAPDPFVAEPFLPGLRRGEPLMADRITWSFSHKSTRPILVDIDGLDTPAVLATNDEAFGVYDPEQSAGAVRFTLLSGEQLKRGNNTLTVALIGREKPITLKQLKKHLKVYTTTDNLTANASWGVAPFAPPADDAFGRIVKSAGMLPCWYRCEFESPSTTLPLWLEPRGLSKGQIYLNGHHLGGYWQATHTGREIGPRKRILLPHGWLNDDEPNQLMLFDEHGKTPDKARLKIASSA